MAKILGPPVDYTYLNYMKPCQMCRCKEKMSFSMEQNILKDEISSCYVLAEILDLSMEDSRNEVHKRAATPQQPDRA